MEVTSLRTKVVSASRQLCVFRRFIFLGPAVCFLFASLNFYTSPLLNTSVNNFFFEVDQSVLYSTRIVFFSTFFPLKVHHNVAPVTGTFPASLFVHGLFPAGHFPYIFSR